MLLNPMAGPLQRQVSMRRLDTSKLRFDLGHETFGDLHLRQDASAHVLVCEGTPLRKMSIRYQNFPKCTRLLHTVTWPSSGSERQHLLICEPRTLDRLLAWTDGCICWYYAESRECTVCCGSRNGDTRVQAGYLLGLRACRICRLEETAV